jgi:hypothetical protein
MKEINDNIGFRRFLRRIFISNSGVSSRRVGGFITLISLLFLVFFKYDIEYCKIIALLTVGFFSLTTVSSLFAKTTDSEQQNDVNNNSDKG